MRLNIYNNKDISDIPLIGNPQITYFSSVYRKHTHYAVKRYKMTCEPGKQVNIDMMGDLIKSIDLEINITGSTSSSNIATSLIKEITMNVGSKEIEKLSGSYMEMIMELNNFVDLSILILFLLFHL